MQTVDIQIKVMCAPGNLEILSFALLLTATISDRDKIELIELFDLTLPYYVSIATIGSLCQFF